MERMQLLDAIIELFEIGDTTLKQNIFIWIIAGY
jgi:hypothetical protein